MHGRSGGHPDAGRRLRRRPPARGTTNASRSVSRCTQLAAFGRSSPSGMRWSASTRRKASDHVVADGRWPRARPHQVDLGRGLAQRRFSSTWIPGGRATASPCAGPGEVDEPQRRAVADQQPASRCSRPGWTMPQERPTASRGASAAGRAPGAARPASASSGPWRLPGAGWSDPAQTPCSLTASQVPPESSSRPPRIRGGPCFEHRDRASTGRSRTSSRLAPTISGSPGDDARRNHQEAHDGSPYRAPRRTVLAPGP